METEQTGETAQLFKVGEILPLLMVGRRENDRMAAVQKVRHPSAWRHFRGFFSAASEYAM